MNDELEGNWREAIFPSFYLRFPRLLVHINMPAKKIEICECEALVTIFKIVKVVKFSSL